MASLLGRESISLKVILMIINDTVGHLILLRKLLRRARRLESRQVRTEREQKEGTRWEDRDFAIVTLNLMLGTSNSHVSEMPE